MDDEDSKARRNFVAVSTIIVLAWWLQAPLDKISEKTLGVAAAEGVEWKAWAALAAALIYFGLRYRFSEGCAAALSDLRRDFEARRISVLDRWLKLELAAYHRAGLAGPLIGAGLKFALECLASSGNLDPKPLRLLPGKCELDKDDPAEAFYERKRSPISGGIAVTASLKKGDREDFPNFICPFALSKTEIAVLSTVASGSLLIYSKSSTALLVPVLIGLIASVVAMLQLYSTW